MKSYSQGKEMTQTLFSKLLILAELHRLNLKLDQNREENVGPFDLHYLFISGQKSENRVNIVLNIEKMRIRQPIYSNGISM